MPRAGAGVGAAFWLLVVLTAAKILRACSLTREKRFRPTGSGSC